MSSTAYTQVKVAIESTVAESFKLACKAANISMAGALSRYMAKFSGVGPTSNSPDLVKKRQRRVAVSKIIQQLERIKASEEYCQNRIPDNLQSAPAFESAETWIDALNDAIDVLNSLD